MVLTVRYAITSRIGGAHPNWPNCQSRFNGIVTFDAHNGTDKENTTSVRLAALIKGLTMLRGWF